ncbi:TonB-dependent receptor domain-containing protein [Neomegalonema perideroedes]|uniref:TonB-dependent receptor domain-containing protein n=1 Tax=Neomegalonema perideroedes TaxID=217219 RepID=UPI00036D6082|nr:TonB-dependent receptor [Neomegalonema perideroedes]
MRRTWRATGTAVGLALAALQGAAQAQVYDAATPQPYVFDAAPAVAVPAPLPAAPAVSAPAPIYDPSPASSAAVFDPAPLAAPAPSSYATAPVAAEPLRAPLPSYYAAPPAAPVVQTPAPAPAAVAAAQPAVVYLDPIDLSGLSEVRPTGTGVAEISGEAMQIEGGVRKLDDVLREVPGVFTRVNSGQPGVAANIRGFEGSGRVNMMVDGVRQNFRFTGHEAQGYGYVDPNLLAGIDVVRGAETGVGGGGLAGSVNFRTLGVSDIVRPGQDYGALGRVSWSDNGGGWSGMAGAGARFENFGLAGAFGFRDSDDYKNGDGATVANSGQELTSGLIKAEAGFGDHSLNLGGVFYENDFAANSYHQTVTNRTLTGGYRYNPENELVDLRANLRFNETKMEYGAAITPSPFATSSGRVVTDKGFGGDLSNRSVARLGPVDLVSVNGVEYFRDDVSATKGGVNPGDGEATYMAAFTDNTLRHGIFDLNVGLRYDHYKLEGSGFAFAGVPYDVDNSDGVFNPSVTLGVEPVEGVRPYAKWSRSLRAPTLQETMLGGTHPPGGGTTGSFGPNPNLKPERQQTFELGATVDRDDAFQPGDRLTGRANYYWMDVDDYIVGTFAAPGTGRPSFINLDGESKLQGFELEAGYDAGPWFLRANYAHMDASKLPSQLPGLGASQYQPDDVFSATAGVRLLDRKLTLGGSYSYVSSGMTADGAGGSMQSAAPSYGLVDLFADYQFNENFRVGAKAANVGDKQYTPWLATSGTGPGRTFTLTGEMRF